MHTHIYIYIYTSYSYIIIYVYLYIYIYIYLYIAIISYAYNMGFKGSKLMPPNQNPKPHNWLQKFSKIFKVHFTTRHNGVPFQHSAQRNNEQNPSRSNPVAAVLCLNLKHLQVILQVMIPDESCSCTWTTHENRHIETAHDPESEVHQNTFWCALMRMDSAGRTNHPILQRTEVSIPQRITNLPTWSNLDLTRM